MVSNYQSSNGMQFSYKLACKLKKLQLVIVITRNSYRLFIIGPVETVKACAQALTNPAELRRVVGLCRYYYEARDAQRSYADITRKLVTHNGVMPILLRSSRRTAELCRYYYETHYTVHYTILYDTIVTKCM